MKRFVRMAGALCLAGLLLPNAALAAQPRGKSSLLMEVSTGRVLRQENPHERLAPASVTKVMTMLLIMEAADSGALRWDDPVTASETAAAKGGSQVYLKAGETMSAGDMMKAIAVSSANDCACAMAEHLAGSEEAFVERMNQRARELGMEDTHFVNCTGLDDGENAAEHRTSAWDIAIMSRELLRSHPGIRDFTTIWMATIRDGTFGLSNTNRMIRFYPGATGVKTGYTSGAGFCLSASARREGMELIAVVMGAPTSKARFAACKSMLDYGFANFALVEPENPGKQSVAVRLGREASVEAEPAGDGALLVEKAKRPAVIRRLSLEPEVSAPVARGQRLGTLRILAGEELLAEIPMVAAKGIPRLTWGQIFARILGKAAMARQVPA